MQYRFAVIYGPPCTLAGFLTNFRNLQIGFIEALNVNKNKAAKVPLNGLFLYEILLFDTKRYYYSPK